MISRTNTGGPDSKIFAGKEQNFCNSPLLNASFALCCNAFNISRKALQLVLYMKSAVKYKLTFVPVVPC